MLLSEGDQEHYKNVYRDNAPDNRIIRFIPASGAASRMFKSLFAALDELEGKRVLTIEIGDRDGVQPLAGVEITLTPAKGEPVTMTTDPAGKAILEIPDGPSTIRIFLEKTYELDLQALL